MQTVRYKVQTIPAMSHHSRWVAALLLGKFRSLTFTAATGLPGQMQLVQHAWEYCWWLGGARVMEPALLLYGLLLEILCDLCCRTFRSDTYQTRGIATTSNLILSTPTLLQLHCCNSMFLKKWLYSKLCCQQPCSEFSNGEKVVHWAWRSCWR